MKAIAYCRVSTVGQREDGISLEMQQSRIEAWCLGNGYDLQQVFVEAMSGSRADNRPELQKALAAVCKAKGVLVVYSLSRLARSVKDTILVAERLEKASANLASLTERIDTNSAIGRMVFRLLSSLAEFEREQLAERVAGAMDHLRRSGRRISRCIPYGFDLNSDGATLTANQGEQQVISEMTTWRKEGASYASIATRLAAGAVLTKEGGQWHSATVRKILDRQRKLAA